MKFKPEALQDTQVVRRSVLDSMVASRRYWIGLAVASVVVMAAVLYYRDVRVSREQELFAAVTRSFGPDEGLRGRVSELERVVESLEGARGAPWGLLQVARMYLELEDFDQAERVLLRLQQEHPDHFVNRVTDGLRAASESRSMVDAYLDGIRSQRDWLAAHPRRTSNPPPADGIAVVLKTSEGDVRIGLYTDRAPRHVANFLKLASNRFYQGTSFFEVLDDVAVVAGDPTVGDETAWTAWGTGGPGYTLRLQENDLYHFAGAVSARATPGLASGEESGSQFYVCLEEYFGRDGEETVFGQVVDGLSVLASLVGRERQPASSTVLKAPLRIEGVEIEGDVEPYQIHEEDDAADDDGGDD